MNIATLLTIAIDFFKDNAPGLSNTLLIAALQLLLPELENILQSTEEKAVAELQEECLLILRRLEIA